MMSHNNETLQELITDLEVSIGQGLADAVADLQNAFRVSTKEIYIALKSFNDFENSRVKASSKTSKPWYRRGERY